MPPSFAIQGRLTHYAGRFVSVVKYVFCGDYTPEIRRMDYDDYWKVKGDFTHSPRYDIFAGLIDRGASVLDIGCGNGANLRHLAASREVQGEGLDVSEVAVARAREAGVKARVADASSPAFVLDRKYDYIIISEVLEHISNPEDLIEKVRGNFTKGLILSLPNIGHYMFRLRLLFGHFPIQWAYHPAEHLRFWTISDFKLWLGRLGLETAVFNPHSGFPLLHSLWPNLFCDSAVFLVREKSPGERK